MMMSSQIQPLEEFEGVGAGVDPLGRDVAPVDVGDDDPLIVAKIASLEVSCGGVGVGLAKVPPLLLFENLDAGAPPAIVFKTSAFEERFAVLDGPVASEEPLLASRNFASFSVS